MKKEDGTEIIEGQESDLYRFVSLLMSSDNFPPLRSACFTVIASLGARPLRDQKLFNFIRLSKLCMEPLDGKTNKQYQGLPPQGLSFPIPKRTIHHPPFA